MAEPSGTLSEHRPGPSARKRLLLAVALVVLTLVSRLPKADQLPPAEVPASRSVAGAASGWAESYAGPEDHARKRRLQLRSVAALVVDQEVGRLLYAKNTGAVMPIASITKLMTAMVVLDFGQPMEEVIAIDAADVDRVKRAYSRLRVGVELRRGDMLKLALMASENRAAAALARSYPGGTSSFVQAMNQKAADLGLQDTHFLDPTGLDPGNVSTPHDLAVMVDAGYQYPAIREFTTSDSHIVTVNERRRARVMSFRNSNGLVRSKQWDIGLTKTGYISESGGCLVMQATIAANPVIIVLLNSPGRQSRMGDANRIKRWVEDLAVGATHAEAKRSGPTG